ncbi:MAG: hypothetical protein K2L14_09850 [Duncaniella sp.]|nr:hypothetical protein [Duncaniella sp.]
MVISKEALDNHQSRDDALHRFGEEYLQRRCLYNGVSVEASPKPHEINYLHIPHSRERVHFYWRGIFRRVSAKPQPRRYYAFTCAAGDIYHDAYFLRVAWFVVWSDGGSYGEAITSRRESQLFNRGCLPPVDSASPSTPVPEGLNSVTALFNLSEVGCDCGMLPRVASTRGYKDG